MKPLTVELTFSKATDSMCEYVDRRENAIIPLLYVKLDPLPSWVPTTLKVEITVADGGESP